jgi:hypothetical protein
VPDTGSDQPQIEDFDGRLAAIEAAVDGGDTDLGALGFWSLLRKLKVHPQPAAAWLDAAGRIDRKAFEARVRPRFPVWLGNAALLIGVLVGAAAVAWAITCDHPTQAALGLLVAAGVWSVSTHDLGHWAVGRAVGIRFLCYFLDGPFGIQPGLKTHYATYLRAKPEGRAAMHAAGAVASKVSPFVALAFWPATNAPGWAALAVVAIGVIQILTDIVWSTKKSDWKKFARERRVAAAVRAARG